jgi:hypothetical protein
MYPWSATLVFAPVLMRFRPVFFFFFRLQGPGYRGNYNSITKADGFRPVGRAPPLADPREIRPCHARLFLSRFC